jgi:hypothetical protein
MKSYYFFVAYQVYSKAGLLLLTGDSLQRIDTGVKDGEYEHFGMKELRESLLKRAIESNPLVKSDSHVIITSLNELSQDLWHQLKGAE